MFSRLVRNWLNFGFYSKTPSQSLSIMRLGPSKTAYHCTYQYTTLEEIQYFTEAKEESEKGKIFAAKIVVKNNHKVSCTVKMNRRKEIKFFFFGHVLEFLIYLYWYYGKDRLCTWRFMDTRCRNKIFLCLRNILP